MKTIFFSLLILLNLGLAQNIQNVQQRIENGRIVITYDLKGNAQDQYKLEITATKAGQSITPYALAGPQIVKPGKQQILWWEPQLENRTLTGWTIHLITQRQFFDMVFVKGGSFQMGSNAGDGDEKPVHSVTVNDYYMGATEVTQAQWKEVMGNNPSSFKGDNLPVENVSWNEIQKFFKKLNKMTGQTYRLPTEAEWEYAARGGPAGSSAKYAGSNSIAAVAWYSENSGKRTHPVGQKKPNALGLYDMTGNVWEWCGDWYADNYYERSPRNNPQGPTSGSSRVLRGGSWSSNARNCRVAVRYRYFPDFRLSYYGFRVLRSASAQ